MASSTKLWHYTYYPELQSILKDGYFRPSEGKGERYDYLDCSDKKFKRVCFTNMSTKDNKTHKGKYGDCCIGFNNNWANKNKLSPIIYCRKEGRLTQLIKRILARIDKEDKDLLLQYCKPYSDYNHDNKDKSKREKLRRYDEQEWRYIPEQDGDTLKFTQEDVYRIYVPESANKTQLEKQYPKYKGKIICYK